MTRVTKRRYRIMEEVLLTLPLTAGQDAVCPLYLFNNGVIVMLNPSFEGVNTRAIRSPIAVRCYEVLDGAMPYMMAP